MDGPFGVLCNSFFDDLNEPVQIKAMLVVINLPLNEILKVFYIVLQIKVVELV